MSRTHFVASAVARTVATLSIVCLFAQAVPAARSAEPTLVLDPQGLADRVDPGDIVATLGDVAVFWLDELDLQSTEGFQIGDTVRLALWRTDGTPAGTYPLLPPEVSFFNYWPDPLNGVVYFTVCRAQAPLSAFDGAECYLPEWVELWRTDGTKEGTFRLLQGDETITYIPSLYYNPPAGLPVPELGKFFFVTRSDDTGPKLWATDGTTGGTRMVRDLSAMGFSGASHLVVFDGALYFYGYKPDGDTYHPWIGRSDGTAAGTRDFPANLDGYEAITSWVPAGDRLFIVALSNTEQPDPESGQMLHRRTIWSMERGSDDLRLLSEAGFRRGGSFAWGEGRQGHLFLEFEDFPPNPDLHPERGEAFSIWASDGTTQGTALVGTTRGFQVQGHLWTDPLLLPEGRALLSLFDESLGREPWISDGTPAGTTLLADICPGECDSYPVGATVLGGWYYFTAQDETYGRELWRWRPADNRVERVSDFCPGECGGYPVIVDRVNDRLFLRALEPDQLQQNIWELLPDGSGAHEVADLDDILLGGAEFIFQRSVIQWKIIGDRAIFWGRADHGHAPVALWAMDAPSADPPPPAGPSLTSEELPGFAVKVRITPPAGDPILGRSEPACIPETLCVSGAVEGRSEVFVRVVGPKPNGNLWPTLVKFTTSAVEVWIEQLATGVVRYYHLESASPGSSDLPGLFDRDGFTPQP